MLLRGRHQRLHDIDVALAAVRLQLYLETVVAEPVDLHRRKAYTEAVANGPREPTMSTTAEDDNLAHDHLAAGGLSFQPTGTTALRPTAARASAALAPAALIPLVTARPPPTAPPALPLWDRCGRLHNQPPVP